jgi:hypothetical protein
MDATATVISHQNVRLCRGAHRSPSEGACVMELVSMLAGERFGDRPRTASPVIAAFLRAYNDIVGDRHRQDLLACAASVVGSRKPDAEAARVRRCVEAALDSYRGQSRWRRLLHGEHRLMIVLALAEDPLDRPELDRFGYRLAQLIRCSPDGRDRAVDLVEELVALGFEGARTRDDGFASSTHPPVSCSTEEDAKSTSTFPS